MKKRFLNNWGLKILAFLITVLTWFIVVNADDPEITKPFSGIKVQVINEEVVTKNERTYQIVSEDEVTVNVTAKRSIINRIDNSKIVATADMDDLQLESLIPIKAEIKGRADYQVSTSAQPGNLKIKIEDEMKKSFPITPVDSGTVRDGSILSGMTANPESITIRGPKSIVENISKVTAEVNVSGLYENTTKEAELFIYDNNNNTVDQTILRTNLNSKPTVAVKLLQGKSVPIIIDDSEITVAEGYEYESMSYEPKEVQIVGEKDVLSGVTRIKIPSLALQEKDLKEKTESTVDISEYLPEGVELADKNAGKIAVTISVKAFDAESFEIATNAIVVKNLDSSLVEKFETAVDVEIQLRGPRNLLSNLSLSNKVSIDLKDYKEAGTYNVPVKVDVEGVSVVQPVSVEVVLEKK